MSMEWMRGPYHNITVIFVLKMDTYPFSSSKPSQCKVIEVVTDRNRPTVRVCWDPMPDVDGKEDVSEETEQEVPPRKFNKNVEGAWRLDINVGIQADSGDTNNNRSAKVSNANDGSDTSSSSSDGSICSDSELDAESDSDHNIQSESD